MTPLAQVLADRIAASGPITVEDYMALCNAHYYATRDPLGAAGDFTTAPEIHQMFGELVGAALADCWRRAGAPSKAIYAELGPGRGTLAADALRVMRKAGFAGRPHLVETSPVLRRLQAERVVDACWHDSIATLPDAPLLLVANEFLDALPLQQWIDGEQRRVDFDGSRLKFDRDGEIVEIAPQRDAAVAEIADRIASHGGVGLFMDYGHARSAPGETLQAVRRHSFADVLSEPGEQDLTSHVDFERAAKTALGRGASVAPLATQSDWLNRLGIGARAAALATANPDQANTLAAAVQRLTGRDAMGDLFKVMAVHARAWPTPAGFV